MEPIFDFIMNYFEFKFYVETLVFLMQLPIFWQGPKFPTKS